MMTLLAKLLPLADKGILSKIETSTLILSGFRDGVDLESLQAELEVEWFKLCKEEAAIRVKNALAAAQESHRPANFFDLAVKLQLGRATPAEQERLNAYYDALDELERKAATLQVAIERAQNVKALNDISWPEWVRWEPLPLRFELLAKPKPIKPDPLKPKRKLAH